MQLLELVYDAGAATFVRAASYCATVVGSFRNYASSQAQGFKDATLNVHLYIKGICFARALHSVTIQIQIQYLNL